MRNLKRALSLALASVMLLGMMVVGTSAAFTDSDQVVNTEAVEITAGLGLFAGNPDGSFNPKGTVTRAQMATVIAKMLYGSDVDADAFKGSGKFSDVANFEGGWADGYVNICAGNNIISGYPDGTFKPGQAVTTAEASVMIIKALKAEIPEGTWPTNVMIKADEMELFEELAVKPGANVALNRDQLASIVWEGMNYSAEGVQGYKVQGSNITFKSWSDAAAYADAAYPDTDADSDSNPDWDASFISEVKGDTLAESVFEIKSSTGYITANQATGEKYTVVAGLNVNLETGLDMLGHYVTVYYKDTYKNEKNPGTAYCVIEEAEYVTVDETIGTYNAGTDTWTGDKKDYLAAFGTKVEVTALTVKDFDGANDYAGPVDYSETSYYADAGTYVISLETGKIIAFIAPVASSIDTVNRITTTAGKESIRLSTGLLQNNADEDEVVEYDGIAEDDIVVVKNYLGKIYLTKPEVVTGKITKTGTVSGKSVAYIDGVAYETASKTGDSIFDVTYGNYAPNADKVYEAYIVGGKLVGANVVTGGVNLSDVIYVVDTYKTTDNGSYGSTTEYYYAQGVDATGKEVSVLIGIKDCHEAGGDYISDTEFAVDGTNTGLNKFYTFEKVASSEDKEQAKKGVMKATEAVAFGRFNAANDDFFADEITVPAEGMDLSKTDKYLTTDAAGRVYLTENTKFIVVEQVGGLTDSLDVVTYTGSIAKEIVDGDKVNVAASEDDNGNKLAEIVVIYAAALNLKAEDYIYVVDGTDFALVDGGHEYTVYFSATNEFKTIIANGEFATGFYGDYEIDEDGIYNLKDAAPTDLYVKNSQLADSVFGTSINATNIDLKDAAKAIFVDVRAEDVLEDSEVAAIESVKDLASALKAGYRVYFSALLEDEGNTQVITNVFVYSVQAETIDPETGLGTGVWVEA